MIRFGVVLSVVLVAIGLLVTGVVAGNLLLVAISIGVAVLAFLMLIGVVISFRQEIFGRPVPAGALAASAAPHGTVPAKVAAKGVAVTETAAEVSAGLRDGAQKKTIGVKTKAPSAEPGTRAPRRAEPPAAVTAGPATRAGSATASTTASTAASVRRSGAPSTVTAGTGPNKSAGQSAPGTEPAAPGKDRPGSAAVKHEDRAEPHRASRLERESAKAASGASLGTKARVARDDDRQQQERPSVGTPRGSAEAKPEPATQAAAGAASDQKPGKPVEPRGAKAASAAGSVTSAAVTPAAADRSEPSAGPPESGPGPQAPASEPSASADSVPVSVVPGITRYHRSDCLLIRFLSADDLEVMTTQAARESGCVPCKACKPDQQTADLPVT